MLAGGTDFYPAQTARAAWLEASAAQRARHFRHRRVEGDQTKRNRHRLRRPHHLGGDSRCGSAARVRRTEARRARGRRPADAEPRHHRGQSLQRLAGGGWRAAAADFGCERRDRQPARAAVGSAGAVHHGQSQDGPGAGRAGDGRPRSQSPMPGARSTFLKLGARAYLVISIVSVAAVVDVGDDGRIAGAAIAVGACSAVPQRLDAVGARSRRRALSPMRCASSTPSMWPALRPIDDVRGLGRLSPPCRAAWSPGAR